MGKDMEEFGRLDTISYSRCDNIKDIRKTMLESAQQYKDQRKKVLEDVVQEIRLNPGISYLVSDIAQATGLSITSVSNYLRWCPMGLRRRIERVSRTYIEVDDKGVIKDARKTFTVSGKRVAYYYPPRDNSRSSRRYEREPF